MPIDEVIIRAAVPADAEALDTLIRDLAAHEGASQLITFSPAQVAIALAGPTPRLRALLAEDASGALGFVTYTIDFAIWNGGDILRVDDVFIVERARRRGIGRLLMLRIAEIAVEMDVTVRWEIEPVNHSAQTFYRSLGVAMRDKIVARWDLAAMKVALANSR